MVSINELPVLCLLKILDFLPIKDLLGVNTVCIHWNELYTSACVRRKCILLENSPGSNSKYALSIFILNEKIITKIKFLFPALTALNFKLKLDSAKGITLFYKHYSANLISTFLDLSPADINRSSNRCDQRQCLIEVLRAINVCTNLKSLTLFLTAPKFINIKQKFTFHLPILAQLTHFRFMSSGFESVSQGDVNMPLDILEQFAQDNEQLNIYLDNTVTLQRAMMLDSAIAKSVKKIQLADTITAKSLSTLVQFLARFSSLEKLILTIDDTVNGDQLGKSLKFNNLKQLNLFSPAPLNINLYAHLPNVILKSNVYF